MINPQKIKLLIREGEGLTVEFKEKYSSRIDEDIVAFSNTKGGILILGVRDDGSISGEKLTNDLKAKILSLARNCKPPIVPEIDKTDNLIIIEISEGSEKPYSCSSGYYRRLNGATQKMSHDEIRIMFRETDIIPFEEKIAKNASIENISRDKIREFVKEAGISIGRITPSDFLKSLNVSSESGITNAGILFFAKNVDNFIKQSQLTLLAFKGSEKMHIFDRQDIKDDLLTQFNQAIFFLKKHLNIRSEIKGVNREDIYEIPIDALREAVVNALMHRDYSITGSQVSIEVYDNRIEIINPGGLPEGLPRKAFGKISIRRNELISDMFFRLKKVERIGMGVKRMRDFMTAQGLKEPEFETDGFFRIVFFRPLNQEHLTLSETTQKSSIATAQKTTQKTTQKIIDLLKEQPGISRKQLSVLTGLSNDGVKYQLKQMKEKGLIRRIGPAKGGQWVVID